MSLATKLIIAIAVLYSINSFAGEGRRIKVFGDGANQEIDLEGQSPKITGEYLVFKKYCTSCHSVRRVTRALNEWRESSSGRDSFDAILGDMMTKKMKLIEGEMSPDDAQGIHHFLLSISYGEVNTDTKELNNVPPPQPSN